MQPFTISCYVRRNDALAQRLPLWGRLRTSIPYDRFLAMTPEENFGVYLVLNDRLSWNVGEMLNKDGSIAEPTSHLGILETHFADNDIRCALKIEKIEPWLHDVVLNSKIDKHGHVRLTREGMVIVLENILRIAADLAKPIMKMGQIEQEAMSQEDVTGRERALQLQVDRLATLKQAENDAWAHLTAKDDYYNKMVARLHAESAKRGIAADSPPPDDTFKHMQLEVFYADTECKRARTALREATERLQYAESVSARQAAASTAPVTPEAPATASAPEAAPALTPAAAAPAESLWTADLQAPTFSAPLLAEPEPEPVLSDGQKAQRALGEMSQILSQDARASTVGLSLEQLKLRVQEAQQALHAQEAVVRKRVEAMQQADLGHEQAQLQKTMEYVLGKLEGRARDLDAVQAGIAPVPGDKTPRRVVPGFAGVPVVQVGIIDRPPRPLSEYAPEVLKDSKIVKP